MTMAVREKFRVDLTGRTVLVTGASSGIGRHFACLLAESGANVVAGARRLDRLEDLARTREGGAGRILPVVLDVSDEQSLVAAYDRAEEVFGRIDSVVANAGINIAASALTMPVEDFDSIVSVNLRGVFLTAREGARRMIAAGSRERGDGRVVIISSITAHTPFSSLAAYSATKAAVSQMGRVLARDWARKGINVNTICPGYMETELTDDLWDSQAGQALLERFPRRRIMDAAALDAMLLYLCSDASAYVTGSVFTIDDGQTL